MSAFPHPNLGPRNPDPVVDRRLRRASGVATVVMVGCIVLMTAADIGPRYFFGDVLHHREHLAIGLGIALLAGGMLLIGWAVRRGRGRPTDG